MTDPTSVGPTTRFGVRLIARISLTTLSLCDSRRRGRDSDLDPLAGMVGVLQIEERTLLRGLNSETSIHDVEWYMR